DVHMLCHNEIMGFDSLGLSCGFSRRDRLWFLRRIEREMTGDEVSIAAIGQFGLLKCTLLLSQRTAGPETAAAGRMQWRRHVAFECHRPARDARLRIKSRNGIEKCPGVGMPGCSVQALRR